MLCYIKNFLFKIFKRKPLYKSLNYGDVLKVHIKKTEKFIFKDFHRNRPFVVIKDDCKYLYGVTTTHKKDGVGQAVYLNSINSNALCFEIIKIKKRNIISKIGFLNEDDKSRLSKKLAYKYNKTEFYHIFQNNIKYSIGDIVVHNQRKFVIYYINGKEVTLVEILKSSKNAVILTLSNKKTYLSKKCETVPLQRFKYLASVSSIDLQQLKKEKNKLKS